MVIVLFACALVLGGISAFAAVAMGGAIIHAILGYAFGGAIGILVASLVVYARWAANENKGIAGSRPQRSVRPAQSAMIGGTSH
jgi:ethanolamine transporter EutH